MLLALAEAPARPETEAVYCPPEFSTLPEYCLPATVVEKLVACFTSSAALLLLPPPPPPPEREVLADEVAAVEFVLVEAVLGDALAEVDEALVDRLTDTGFNTVAVELLDEILRICMTLSPLRLEVKSLPNRSSAESFPALGEIFNPQVMAQERRARKVNESLNRPTHINCRLAIEGNGFYRLRITA
jgi:hypothetical protein